MSEHKSAKNLLSHAKWLRQAAEEIAKAGHTGWGNTCLFAAEAIEAECTADETAATLAETVERRYFDALREIASYQGDDRDFDINAANMRQCAREALVGMIEPPPEKTAAVCVVKHCDNYPLCSCSEKPADTRKEPLGVAEAWTSTGWRCSDCGKNPCECPSVSESATDT